jgi:hypothetical protein
MVPSPRSKRAVRCGERCGGRSREDRGGCHGRRSGRQPRPRPISRVAFDGRRGDARPILPLEPPYQLISLDRPASEPILSLFLPLIAKRRHYCDNNARPGETPRPMIKKLEPRLASEDCRSFFKYLQTLLLLLLLLLVRLAIASHGGNARERDKLLLNSSFNCGVDSTRLDALNLAPSLYRAVRAVRFSHFLISVAISVLSHV